ncbi:MAG: nucleotidyltransferase domain-containing protein [Caldilineaceae bacterium]|nr:nucleotidyltransferase domain-containing protein [Caldilineaceae bacterium]
MHDGIQLDKLPLLPQAAFLHTLVPALWQRSDVLGLWLEGSLGRGNADLYSDIDLYIGVTPASLAAWRTLAVADLFGDAYAAHHFSPFAENFFVYHVYLTAGGIYDLHIQPRDRELPKSQRLLLACRDDAYRAELLAAVPDTAGATPFGPQPVDPAALASQLVFFWINVDKSRKVIYRHQDFTIYTGIHLFRQLLARLLFIEQTGTDCGDLTRPSIHGLKAASDVLPKALGAELGQLMGAPTTTRLEMWEAQERVWAAVARAGRVVAAQFQINYPEALEQIVLENWRKFKQEELGLPG